MGFHYEWPYCFQFCANIDPSGGLRLKITKVEVVPLSVPLKEPWKESAETFTTLDHAVVLMHADSGLVGIGEGCTDPKHDRDFLEGLTLAVQRYLGPSIIGMDPREIQTIHQRLNKVMIGNLFAKASIDFALHDLVGKTLDLPVYRLLGGRVREKLELAPSLLLKDPDQTATDAIKRVEEGFRVLKVKIGISPEEDMVRFKAVRDAVGGKIAIRADANGAYSPSTSIRLIRKLERYEPELVEQPVPRSDFEGMAEVARAVDVPIEMDEGISSPEDAMRAARLRAADIFNLKIAKYGITVGRKIATIAELSDIACKVGSMPELGPGTAACAHFAVATPAATYACEQIGPLYVKDDILQEPLIFKNGTLELNDRPGLGIALDERKVSQYSQKFN